MAAELQSYGFVLISLFLFFLFLFSLVDLFARNRREEGDTTLFWVGGSSWPAYTIERESKRWGNFPCN